MWCAKCRGQSLAYVKVQQEHFYKRKKRKRGMRQGSRFLDPDIKLGSIKCSLGLPTSKPSELSSILTTSVSLSFVFLYKPKQFGRNWPSPWTPHIILIHPFTCPSMNSLTHLLISSHTQTHAHSLGPLCAGPCAGCSGDDTDSPCPWERVSTSAMQQE